MAERFLREARSEPGGNLGKVVEGEGRSPRPAQRRPRVAKRHHAKRSGQTPRVTISAKRKYVIRHGIYGVEHLVLDSENTRTYGREIFAGGKERARRQPWKGCRGRGTQPAARAAEPAGREATSREKIRPDAASDHLREAEIRHGIYGVDDLDRKLVKEW